MLLVSIFFIVCIVDPFHSSYISVIESQKTETTIIDFYGKLNQN